MNRILGSIISIFLAAICITSSHAANPDLTLSNAWIREAPPNAKVSAAYLTIRNTGSTPQILLSVNAEHFSHAEIHKSELHGEMARMVKQENVEIPANSSVSFTPGGLHLMLLEPATAPKAGSFIKLSLRFSSAVIDINAEVKAAQPGEHEPTHQHHDHHDH